MKGMKNTTLRCVRLYDVTTPTTSRRLRLYDAYDGYDFTTPTTLWHLWLYDANDFTMPMTLRRLRLHLSLSTHNQLVADGGGDGAALWLGGVGVNGGCWNVNTALQYCSNNCSKGVCQRLEWLANKNIGVKRPTLRQVCYKKIELKFNFLDTNWSRFYCSV